MCLITEKSTVEAFLCFIILVLCTFVNKSVSICEKNERNEFSLAYVHKCTALRDCTTVPCFKNSFKWVVKIVE